MNLCFLVAATKILSALSFGLWQDSFSAGAAMFCFLTCIEVIHLDNVVKRRCNNVNTRFHNIP